MMMMMMMMMKHSYLQLFECLIKREASSQLTNVGSGGCVDEVIKHEGPQFHLSYNVRTFLLL